jgi:hypothetical protein
MKMKATLAVNAKEEVVKIYVTMVLVLEKLLEIGYEDEVAVFFNGEFLGVGLSKKEIAEKTKGDAGSIYRIIINEANINDLRTGDFVNKPEMEEDSMELIKMRENVAQTIALGLGLVVEDNGAVN